MLTQKDDYTLGADSANALLAAWEGGNPEIRKSIVTHIQMFLEHVLRTVKSGIDISAFAVGYFSVMEKRNEPDINMIIAPLINKDVYRDRKID